MQKSGERYLIIERIVTPKICISFEIVKMIYLRNLVSIKHRQNNYFMKIKSIVRQEAYWCTHAAAFVLMYCLVFVPKANEFKSLLKMPLEN
jgi:hypothetical protein